MTITIITFVVVAVIIAFGTLIFLRIASAPSLIHPWQNYDDGE